jgi:hypothetical protein
MLRVLARMMNNAIGVDRGTVAELERRSTVVNCGKVENL